MPNNFERRIIINSTSERIFDYISDLERHCEWATNPLTISIEGGKPIRIGTTFYADATLMGKRRDVGRVTEFVRPSRFAFETEGPAGVVENWFEITPTNNGCVVVKGSRNTKLSWFSVFMMPLLYVVAPRMYARNLRSIKVRVESNSPSFVLNPTAPAVGPALERSEGMK